MFDAAKYRVTCDRCGQTCGSGEEPYNADVTGVPDGWTALVSKGAFLFACAPLCEADIAATLIKAYRPFTSRIV